MPRRTLWMIVGGAVVVVALLAWRLHQNYWRMVPIRMPDRWARVNGWVSVEDLALRLQQKQKLRYPPALVGLAHARGLMKVAPGVYRLPVKAGPRELVEVFRHPPTLRRVTFPEGWTGMQIVARLRQQQFRAADQLQALLYPPGQVPPFEGRLFPETYELPLNGRPLAVIHPLLMQYQKLVTKLPQPFPQGQQAPLTLQQVTILASLVERETSEDSERPLIAGVLLNRLRRGKRLECDATIQYLLELTSGHRSRLTHADLWIDSPYNTYRHAGLPPAPICNPGWPSLQAAARPAQTSYLFYVMSPRWGRHRFARDFATHQQNVRLERQERQQVGIPGH